MEQLERIKAYAKDYRRVPIAKEIFADVRTVIGTLRVLKKVSRTAFLFESADNTERWGRYSFLGYDPKLELFVKNGKMTVKGAVTETFETDDPASVIRKVLHEYHSPEIPGMPTFTGGLVGYFAYEYARYSEKKLYFKEEKEPDISFNDADLMLFDKVIAFDHYRKTIILITNVDTSEIETNYEKAVRELDEMAFRKESSSAISKTSSPKKSTKRSSEKSSSGSMTETFSRPSFPTAGAPLLKEASSMLTGCFGQSILRPTCSTFQATT